MHSSVASSVTTSRSTSGAPAYTLDHVITDNPESEIFCIKFSPDGQLLMCGLGDGTVKCYNVVTGRALYCFSTAISDAEAGKRHLPVTSIRFRPSTESAKTRNIALIASCEGTIQHWHFSSGRCLHSIEEEHNQVLAVDYRQDGLLFASTGEDTKVRVYDEATKSLISTHKGGDERTTCGHTNRVFALKWHPDDENIVVTGGWDDTVQIWDIRMDHAVRRIFGPHICGDSVDMDGNVLLTGSWRPDDQVQLWDFTSGKLMRTFGWPTKPGDPKCSVYAVQFSPNKTYIAAGGSGANEFRVMERESGRDVTTPFRGLDRAVYTVDFHPNSTSVAFGTGDGRVYLLNSTASE